MAGSAAIPASLDKQSRAGGLVGAPECSHVSESRAGALMGAPGFSQFAQSGVEEQAIILGCSAIAVSRGRLEHVGDELEWPCSRSP